MPQPILQIIPDPYSDPYNPQTELSSLSDGNLSDETSGSIDYMVESDSELPDTLPQPNSPVLSATTASSPHTGLSTLVLSHDVFDIETDSQPNGTQPLQNDGIAPGGAFLYGPDSESPTTTNPSARSSISESSPYLLSGWRSQHPSLIGPEIFAEERFSNLAPGTRFHFESNDITPIRYSRLFGSHPRPPTPPISTLLASLPETSEPLRQYTVEVINSDGYILSVAAPSRRTFRTDQSRRGALPLTRQNAIRIKKDRSSDLVEPQQKIKALHLDFIQLLQNTDKALIFKNKVKFSPCLISFNSNIPVRILQPEQEETMTDKLDRLQRERYNQTVDLSRNLSSIMDADMSRYGQNKREHKEQVSATNKKRKLYASNNGNMKNPMTVPPSVKLGTSINDKYVPPIDGSSILDGLFCSYVSDGSTFHIPGVDDSNKELNMDFRIMSVNYELKKLQGQFTFKENISGRAAMDNIGKFVSFLAGNEPHAKRLTQSLFRRKIFAVCGALYTCAANNTDETLLKICKSTNFPVSGTIVDFKKNDLRFLRNTYPGVRRAHHVFQSPGKDTEFELLQWLRIPPFFNFAESKFYKTIETVERYLFKSMQKSQDVDKSNLKYVQGFRKLIHEISKGYCYLKGTDIPFESNEGECRRIDSRFRKSAFFTLWETKHAEEFCEHILKNRNDLTNVQLNFVLFTLELDVTKVLDTLFWKVLEHIPNKLDRQKYEKFYTDAREPNNSALSGKAVFVCSVNRKNGELHIHNTRPSFEYRLLEYLDQMRFQDHRDPIFKKYAQIMMVRLGHRIMLEDPESAKIQTILKGSWRREAGASIASNLDGVCGNYSVA